MPALLVAALIIVPIVDIWVLLQVGQLLGVLQTVVLLVVMSLLGAYLLRREGARTWRAFRTALASGRLPAAEVADGALVILGGALLLTPGFATDAFGLPQVLDLGPGVSQIVVGIIFILVTLLVPGGIIGGVEGLLARVRERATGAGVSA